MALTKTVTKLWPTISKRGVSSPGIHLIIEDDTQNPVEVINESFTEEYIKGTLNEVVATLLKKAQNRIDRYKTEKLMYGKAAYSDAVTAIDAALDITE